VATGPNPNAITGIANQVIPNRRAGLALESAATLPVFFMVVFV
jgi:hypothetical protein